MVSGAYITVKTKGFSDVCDITGEVAAIVQKSGIKSGIVTVFVVGSTASVSTIEFEPALNHDLQDQLERMIPHSLHSRHSQTWGDDNGFSHIRATLMGPCLTVPLTEGELILGTWQQIVVVDHDNRSRNRKIFVQVLGE